MTNRDQRKPPEYWARLLAAQARWIKDAEKGCATARSASRRESACRFVWWNRLENVLAGFSAGWSKAQLQDHYAKVVPAFVHHARSDEYVGSSLKLFDYYVRMLWLVSLGFVLDDASSVRDIAKHAKHDCDDELLDRLIALSVQRHAISKAHAHAAFSRPLLAALVANDATGAAKEIRTYLARYYPALKKTWYWDTHRKDDILYFGYWSFESAAVAKCQGVDPVTFANEDYFPVI